ncbi:hypothetical protein PVAND_017130 [Polypedilum vanderplanki]|uniref:Tetratricopeptide repeat protein n=1 Tax=Polypedilum vanderplanki TaxID=319348 RepID=A0A9J6BII8_POLVA|nr:hypothetical protein PVAND_017130 [Polypedilum vanderplanki]
MSHISDFTEKNIKILYDGFDAEKGIEIEESEDFTCIRFQSTNWEQAHRPSSARFHYENPETYCLQSRASTSRLIKKIFNFEKFFDKITGIFLGDSKDDAIKESSRLGVEKFIKGDLKEAERFFKIAYKNAEIDSNEENINKELLNVTNLIIEADSDLKKEKYNDYVLKMQNAYITCQNGTMKSIIADKRNCQAEIFSQMAEIFFSERKYEETEKFYKFAFKLCTGEYPKKEEFEAVMNGCQNCE